MLSVLTTDGLEKHSFSAAALASTVASKLGSAVFSVVTSFWGSSKSSDHDKRNKGSEATAKTEPALLDPAHALTSALALEDGRRVLAAIVVDASRRYAATCDSFGRVMLIDMTTMTIVRMWKGYREASCAFTRTFNPATGRSSLCLAIYAPKRDLLEVWPVRDGPRLAAFGLPGPACLHAAELASGDSCAYIVHANGTMERIVVPAECLIR